MEREEQQKDPIVKAADIIIALGIIVGGAALFMYIMGDVWKTVSLYTLYGFLCVLVVIIVGCAVKVKRSNIPKLRRSLRRQ